MCEVDPVVTVMIVAKDRVLTLQWPILSFGHRVSCPPSLITIAQGLR